ncbi:Nitrogenase FeMo-cofactor synthesis FeS core scaffold and assembly protein NifB [Rhodovulum sp. P5]|uniref:nitrogenase cofactor biosynthesis protein NifB n=1 Tax=Rhodovulum sp. P5 TaxID=1564506 RepID=UPI0009C3426C|nr:nitrogenase cofactor biosynthesis protein NifB [Rhodovulum sp. P5]ARE40494.1 Nitrogenase FeMo-cofactor synthesis FeS core scaffold and assembly protein NifB [Rhodovulum sp. P5]
MSAPLIPISGLTVSNRKEMGAELSKGGCSSSSCGSSAGPEDMDPKVWAKVKDHPCYSEEAHHYFARMHVAVAPACNIQCNYCNRKYDCANESRPGVVSERLTPEQAARKVLAVAAEVPQLSVLGIAGPGDAAYDWRKTKATFDLVSEKLPDIKLCLSSNGLSLPDYVDQIVDMNVDHVTITINAIYPEIGAKIYPWIFYKGKRRTGLEAATILRDRQLQALEMLTEREVLVKVNSVLIPGINDDHMVEVNKAVKKRGAFLHNIMPLISDPAHGTHFGLTGQRGPTAAELKKVQDECADGANLMRHCRQCRADAVGLLGEDRGQEFTLDKLPEVIPDGSEAREAYRDWVAEERKDRETAAKYAEEAAAETVEKPVLFAVCTQGSGRINLHFGKATEFQMYEADADGIRFVGHRRADNYCLGGYGDEDRMDEIIRVLEDVPYVLCQMIGGGPRKRLSDAGIEAIDSLGEEYIETAIAAVLKSRAARRAKTA